jgi:prepilin-type N-terminal cleavage/methylation domain-containing protein
MSSHPKVPRGFTLIEVVVVVTILVLLAGVLIPIVSNELEKARTARAQTDMKAVADAFSRYFAHTAVWPSNEADLVGGANTSETLAGLSCLYENVYTKKGWAGPYMMAGNKVGSSWQIATSTAGVVTGLSDPWGRLYHLYYFMKSGPMGPGGGIALVCGGPDGTVNSSQAQIADAAAAGDDIVQIVTRRL